MDRSGPDSPHFIHRFDRVQFWDGSLGYCTAADLRTVTVSFDPPGACPHPEVKTFDQFDHRLRWVETYNPWEHDKWASVEDAESRLSRIEHRIDDIEDEIDGLYAERSRLREEASELREALHRYRKMLNKLNPITRREVADV